MAKEMLGLLQQFTGTSGNSDSLNISHDAISEPLASKMNEDDIPVLTTYTSKSKAIPGESNFAMPSVLPVGGIYQLYQSQTCTHLE